MDSSDRRKLMWKRLVCMLSIGTLAFASLPAEQVPKIAPGFALPNMERLSNDVYIAKIASDLWIYTTVGKLQDGSLYAANGALVEDGKNSILIDPGWNPEQAEILLNWAHNTLKHPVAKAYVTHFHSDRLGGTAALEKRHIPVFAMQITIELAGKSNQPVPDHSIELPSVPASIGKGAMILFPGAGHTKDNVVVYFPKDRVLFGGCFIKAGNATGLGNITDADLRAWPDSIKRMQAAFPEADVVIPGHGPMGKDGTKRTLELLK